MKALVGSVGTVKTFVDNSILLSTSPAPFNSHLSGVWSRPAPANKYLFYWLLRVRSLGTGDRRRGLLLYWDGARVHNLNISTLLPCHMLPMLPSSVIFHLLLNFFNFATFNTLFNSRAARHGAALLHLCCHSEGKMSLNFERYFSWKFGISEYSVTFRLFTRRTVAECWDIIYIFSPETERTANTAWPSPLSHVGNYIYRYLDISI